MLAKTLESWPGIFINCGNTNPVTLPFSGVARHCISIGRGGLSGSSLFARTIEMVSLLSSFSVPIMATGGIDSFSKVKRVLKEGASLVGMASALIYDPYIIPRVNKEL